MDQGTQARYYFLKCFRLWYLWSPQDFAVGMEERETMRGNEEIKWKKES